MSRKKQPLRSNARVCELYVSFAPVHISTWAPIAKDIHKIFTQNHVDIDCWEIKCYRPDGNEENQLDLYGSLD